MQGEREHTSAACSRSCGGGIAVVDHPRCPVRVNGSVFTVVRDADCCQLYRHLLWNDVISVGSCNVISCFAVCSSRLQLYDCGHVATVNYSIACWMWTAALVVKIPIWLCLVEAQKCPLPSVLTRWNVVTSRRRGKGRGKEEMSWHRRWHVLPQSFPTKLHQFLINIFFQFFCADRQTDT